MIALRTAVPALVLREFVRIYAEREVLGVEQGATSLVEAIPPRLEQTLEFQLGAPFTVLHCEGYRLVTPPHAIIGAQTLGCSHIALVPGVRSFGVFFNPTGFSRLLRLPVCELTNRNFDAASIFKSVRELADRLAGCRSFDERVCVVDSSFQPLALRARAGERVIAAAEHIFSRRGAISVSQLANDMGLGVRQFERAFLQDVGISPKRYARVARFQSALDAKLASPHLNWLHIAHSLGYFDQMHMIRDFQSLGGDTPTHLLLQIGDARPPSLLKK